MLFVGHELTDRHWEQVETIANGFPQTRLTPHRLNPEWLRHATSPKSFITPVALGRMFLPRLSGGRVLYVDGDTLVVDDIGALGDVDLGGHSLGAVRDFVVQRRRRAGHTERLGETRTVMGEAPVSGYFNSGALLFDCDAIRAEASLMAAMEDMRAAQGFGTVDQDRLNQLFRGRVRHLNPAWNCSWGRLSQQHRLTADLPQDSGEAEWRPAAILHFHGPNKPWQKLRPSMLSRGALAIVRYRRTAAQLARRFPFLAVR